MSKSIVPHKLGKFSASEGGAIVSSGTHKVAKLLLIFSVVMDEVEDFVMSISIHVEWASTRMRNMCPKNGTA